MPDLVEFPVAGGGTVLVAATRSPSSDGALFRGGGPRDVVARSAETIQSAIAQLKPAAQALVDTFIELPRRPDDISVTFGIELSAEAGAIIASTAASANFSVTISWKATTVGSEEG
jgi:Trypsin-co-occurring domain 1